MAFIPAISILKWCGRDVTSLSVVLDAILKERHHYVMLENISPIHGGSIVHAKMNLVMGGDVREYLNCDLDDFPYGSLLIVNRGITYLPFQVQFDVIPGTGFQSFPRNAMGFSALAEWDRLLRGLESGAMRVRLLVMLSAHFVRYLGIHNLQIWLGGITLTTLLSDIYERSILGHAGDIPGGIPECLSYPS